LKECVDVVVDERMSDVDVDDEFLAGALPFVVAELPS
jgi:hypothetical protein